MDQKVLKKIVEELGINRPIIRFETVKPKHFRIVLYGGEELEYVEGQTVGLGLPPLPHVHNMKVAALRDLAAELGVLGAAKLRKAELIAAIGAYYDDATQERD